MVVGSRKEQSLGRQGRVSAEATRYALRGTVSPRRVSDAPGGYRLARCGGRVTLARPPVLRVAFLPGGLGGRGGGAVTDTKALAEPLYRRTGYSRANGTRSTHTQRAQAHNQSTTRKTETHERTPDKPHVYTLTHTSLTPPDRRTMPINRRHRPASQPHSLSHPHAQARSPGEPSPAPLCARSTDPSASASARCLPCRCTCRSRPTSSSWRRVRPANCD